MGGPEFSIANKAHHCISFQRYWGPFWGEYNIFQDEAIIPLERIEIRCGRFCQTM
jgi:hypothetical protein